MIRDKLSNSNASCIFKILDLNNDISKQVSFIPSYYDLVILSNTFGIENIKTSIENLVEIISPNGHLLINDSNYKLNLDDPYYENYTTWLSYNYFNIKSIETLNEWDHFLKNDLKFNNFISTTIGQSFLIQVQKSNLKDKITTKQQPICQSYDQVLIYGDKFNNYYNKLFNCFGDGDITRIYSINEFERHVSLKPLTENSLIIFFESVNQISIDKLNNVTLEYCEINKWILKNEVYGCKHILISRNVYFESLNPMAASLIGSFRYFCEFNQLNLYSFEIDDFFFTGVYNFNMIIQELSNQKLHIQREYIIRNDNIFYERIKLESNLKLKYKSESYVDNHKELVARLNTDLSFSLEPIESVLPNYVEIQIKAVGINFKDTLTYNRLIDWGNANCNGDATKPQFGYEMSGIVTRVGSDVTKFKIGDHVMGPGFHLASSIGSVDQDRLVLKPSNLTWVQAASISMIYLTSYCSLFQVGKLDKKGSTENVLIHSGTGGIGMACIELLKAFKFKGNLFVTVGSDEKKQYLIDRYGDFITGIYSSKNVEFEFKIKEKLLEITNGNLIIHRGRYFECIDLIINSLPIEFLETNFNVLSQGGRIVDLTINHLNISNSTDFRKFDMNIGYHTYETLVTGLKRNKKVLPLLVEMLQRGELKPLPIREYPVSKIKEAIESLMGKEHIGKVVVNFETSNDLVLETINIHNKSINNLNFNNNYLYQLPNYTIGENTLGKTILFTGQTGLSKSIIKWIENYKSHTIESIIVLSKSPIKYELLYLIETFKMGGLKLNVYFKQCDISDEQCLTISIQEIYNGNPNISPIESIFHNAFSPSECEPLEIDLNHLIESHSAKTIGAFNLHKLSLNWPIKQFVLASSVTSILGSNRQCGYVAANNVIDALARYRHSLNLPCLSINWGLLGKSGYISRNINASKLFESQGFIHILPNTVYGTLDLLLQNQNQHQQISNKMVCSFDFKSTSKSFKYNLLNYKIDYFTNPWISKELVTDKNEFSFREEILLKFSQLISIEVSKLNPDVKIIDYGADSLLIANFKNHCDKTISPNILTISQIQSSTINQIINDLTIKIQKLPKKLNFYSQLKK